MSRLSGAPHVTWTDLALDTMLGEEKPKRVDTVGCHL